MNKLLKLSMMSRLDNKRKSSDFEIKGKENLKELGSLMAKESLTKILVKI